MSKLSGPSPQPSPQRGEGAGRSAGEFGVPRLAAQQDEQVGPSAGGNPFPRPFGERDAGRQGEGTALAKTTVARSAALLRPTEAGWSAGEFGVPRPSGERDAGRQGEGTALAKTTVARRLRRDSTEAENRLWTHLRNRQLAGWKFVRQLPVAGFYADFACREAMLIIEVDGSQHAESTYDTVRTARLNAEGYRVLRFWNNEVLQETDSVLLAILEGLQGQRKQEGNLS